MSHLEKLEAMRQHTERSGIARSTAEPPLWKLFWRMGWDVPSPLFMGFWQIALVMGGFFGVFWGLVMWMITWSRHDMPLWLAVSAAAVAGILFGGSMAFHLRRLARKHRLPSWQALAPDNAADDRQVP